MAPRQESVTERRLQPRDDHERWQTALTSIAPNQILIRGYALDEMMGRLSFADAVYLLLMGELPTPAIGRMLNAVLVSSLDHGVTPPSTLAASNVATSGAPLKDCVGRGHSRLRSASRRRHRVVHAVPRRRADARAEAGARCSEAAETSSPSASIGAARRPASAIGSTRATRAPRVSFRWRSSSSSKASTSG